MIKPKPKTAEIVQLEGSRIITPMSASLIAKIDKEWHKRELPSRSATIRELIEESLSR